MENKEKSKRPTDKGLLTLFIIMIPSLVIAMSSTITTTLIRVPIQIILILLQYVVVKSFLDDYQKLREKLKVIMSRGKFPHFLIEMFTLTVKDKEEYEAAKTDDDLAEIIIKDAKGKGCKLLFKKVEERKLGGPEQKNDI